jgi:type 1 glutamine amidotransferase
MKRNHRFLALAITTLTAVVLTTQVQAAQKVLYFTKSSGFQHSVVTRDGDRLAHSERIMAEICANKGFEFVITKDGSYLTPDRIKEFDTIVFYTSGNLLEPGTDGFPALSQESLDALFDYVKNGGSFMAIHAATDTLRTEPPSEYTKMVGGTFRTHGAQEVATVKVVDPNFPAMKGLPVEFAFQEEWYLHQQINVGKDMHVLMLLDCPNMKQDMYNQLPPQPMTWCSKYGKGRVFVTAIGHREDVWESPWYKAMLGKGLDWTLGNVDGNAAPNFDQFLK